MTYLTTARRIVLKVGSALMIDPRSGQADAAFLSALATDIARLRERKQQALVVSSGAVALGRRRLGLTRRKLTLEEKQAAAAAGQSLLMRAWEEALAPHGLACAQVLLTRDDTEVRRRWLNARATVETLLGLGAVPVANENDTVATEEIRYGDNDRLAARIAQMVQADVLVLLSDVDGLYTADPRRDGNARHLPRVREITPEVEAMAGGANAGSGVGTGGMATKLAAARIAGAAGCATVITLGRPLTGGGALAALESGGRCTVFEPSATPSAAYKAWIAGSLAPQGVLTVDIGCVVALRAGKSLLPAGVQGVEGAFDKGDAVVVRDTAGQEIARGLAAYDAASARALAGRRSVEIEAVLGYAGPSALIHRDHLVWTGSVELKP